ncbi:MAG: phenylacetic acid degradation operon negative regulatory protein PaaX [Gammaproteobacteria bacterium]|nr:phenylacetic acid degradation operon negative regulatory protein PaaX [Gammaproteobacteria bacterium]
MSLASAADALVTEFRARPTIRAGSLIITVFGDAIAPRGGTVWIGSLIRVLSDFGINERLVRTSVFRLARDGWLEVDQVGRRSYYSLSSDGAEKFEQATARIYGDPRQSWDGDWCLVLLAGLDAEQKEAARKDLSWLGFGAISNNVLAHPKPAIGEVEIALRRNGLDEQVVLMRGTTLGRKQDDAMRGLVHKSWNLDVIGEQYAAFVEQFRPVFRPAQSAASVDARIAFQVRTLLIQEYRRILLRDPLLPAELLPANWNGTAAYQLCRNLYGLVYAAADDFMSSEFETAEGPLPPPAPEFFRRFGGLD